MKEETKKKLDRMIMMQRLKYAGILAGILVVLGAFAVFEVWEADKHVDKVTQVVEVAGTVQSVQRSYNRNGGYALHVQLDDGTWVNASSTLSTIPYEGEKLKMKEYVHASGRKEFVAEKFEE